MTMNLCRNCCSTLFFSTTWVDETRSILEYDVCMSWGMVEFICTLIAPCAVAVTAQLFALHRSRASSVMRPQRKLFQNIKVQTLLMLCVAKRKWIKRTFSLDLQRIWFRVNKTIEIHRKNTPMYPSIHQAHELQSHRNRWIWAISFYHRSIGTHTSAFKRAMHLLFLEIVQSSIRIAND